MLMRCCLTDEVRRLCIVLMQMLAAGLRGPQHAAGLTPSASQHIPRAQVGRRRPHYTFTPSGLPAIALTCAHIAGSIQSAWTTASTCIRQVNDRVRVWRHVIRSVRCVGARRALLLQLHPGCCQHANESVPVQVANGSAFIRGWS